MMINLKFLSHDSFGCEIGYSVAMKEESLQDNRTTNTLFRKSQIVEKGRRRSTHKLFRTVTINLLGSIELRTKASAQYWPSTYLFSKNLENKSLDHQYLSVYFWTSQYSSTHRQLIDSLRHTWSSIYWEVLLSIYWCSVLAPLVWHSSFSIEDACITLTQVIHFKLYYRYMDNPFPNS